jgi:hypothetical protein
MSVWRAFYTTYLDVFNFRSMVGTKLDRGREMQHFTEALRSALLLSLACCIVLQVGCRGGAGCEAGPAADPGLLGRAAGSGRGGLGPPRFSSGQGQIGRQRVLHGVLHGTWWVAP